MTAETSNTVSPSAVEDVLSGGELLRRALWKAPHHTAAPETVIVSPEMREAPIFLLTRGMAYSSTTLANGRRAIPDFFLTGDIVGVEHMVVGRPSLELRTASLCTYHALTPAELRALMANHQVALSVMSSVAEERRRQDQHIVALTRCDARARIAFFLLGIYDRLRQRELVTRPTFTLPLTQEQIADHVGLTMVHVSRTLRRLREERLALVDRQVVIIRDLAGLRRAAAGDEEPAGDTAGDRADPMRRRDDRRILYPAPPGHGRYPLDEEIASPWTIKSTPMSPKQPFSGDPPQIR